MKIIFFGTSGFALPILEHMKKSGLAPVLVISTPDKPKGRGLKTELTPVKKWAEANGIRLLQPEKLKDQAFLEEIRRLKPDLFAVAAYGKIIPKELLDVPEKGGLNVHPSLLPAWRGADPIRAAMLAGDKKTGLTIILMDQEMDHGPILAQEELKFPISDFQFSKLQEELAELGGGLLVKTTQEWLSGKIKPKTQDHSKATFSKKIAKEDGHINWSEPAEIIERKIRAFNPWPGTFTFWGKKRLKILETDAGTPKLSLGTSPKLSLGIVFKKNGGVAVACKDGAILIKKLQIEGKKIQSATEFLNGRPDIIGAVLN